MNVHVFGNGREVPVVLSFVKAGKLHTLICRLYVAQMTKNYYETVSSEQSKISSIEIAKLDPDLLPEAEAILAFPTRGYT